jgi:hypothetical protein
MVLHHFQHYFSYIVALSFIGGGNRRTWRKPPTCRKSHVNDNNKFCFVYFHIGVDSDTFNEFAYPVEAWKRSPNDEVMPAEDVVSRGKICIYIAQR